MREAAAAVCEIYAVDEYGNVVMRTQQDTTSQGDTIIATAAPGDENIYSIPFDNPLYVQRGPK